MRPKDPIHKQTRGAESKSPGVVSASQESESDQATSTPTPDHLLHFYPVRAGQKYFWVKLSGISPFSSFPIQHRLNYER